MKHNALIIIIIMALGVVATASYYANYLNPNCGTPPTGGTPSILPGSGGYTTINGQTFISQNVTFTASNQQVVVSNRATFQTLSFYDPSFLHAKNGVCVSEPNLPFKVTLQISTSAGTQQFSFDYGGNPPAQPVDLQTSYTQPQGGVRWLPGTSYLNLLVAA